MTSAWFIQVKVTLGFQQCTATVLFAFIWPIDLNMQTSCNTKVVVERRTANLTISRKCVNFFATSLETN